MSRDTMRELGDGRVTVARVLLSLSLVSVALVGCGGGRQVSSESFQPLWSPDGRSIAFVLDPRPSEGCPYGSCGVRYEIWLMKPNGSNARKLTRAFEASWSPDGRRFAIERDGQIYTIEADGTRLRRLTRHFDDRTAVWAPDGKRIAFVRYPRIGGNTQLLVMNPDGTGQRRLTRLDADMPSWSPTGEIAFTTFDGLFTVGSDGQGLRKLFGGSVGSYAGVNPIAWSPDGTQIAFDTDGGLAVVDRQAHRRFLIAPGNPSVENKPTDVEGYPTWSPDGKKILFESCRGIETIAADGTHRTLVRSTAGGCGFQSYPVWSPDGQRIAFNEDSQIYVMGANGSGLKKLTPIPGEAN